MSSQSNTKKVEFTRSQIEYLNNQFPEFVGNQTTSADELKWRAAQRSVVLFISTREDKGQR
jgi:hypothetical protein